MFKPPFTLSTQESAIATWRGDGVLLLAETQRRHPYVVSLIEQLRTHTNPVNNQPFAHEFVATEKLSGTSRSEEMPNGLNSAEMEKMRGAALDLLADAARHHTSTISINILDNNAIVRYRISGDTFVISTESATWGLNLCRAIIQGMTENTSETHFTPRVPIDARLASSVPRPKGVREVRISTMPTGDAFEMYLRLQYANTLDRSTFEELGLLEKDADILRDMGRKEKGLILFIGPTGSGKTNIAMALLRYIDAYHSGRRRIVTVEDPIEIRAAERMTQTLPNGDYALFDRALMRADPDVIYQSEIRDRLQMESACRKAASGHMVISTLHTNNVFDIPKRFQTEGINETLLMDSNILLGAVACRLVATLCQACCIKAEDVQAPLTTKARLFENDMGSTIRFRGPGCDACDHRGTKGIETFIGAAIRFDIDIISALLKQDYALAHALWRMDEGNTLRAVARIKCRMGIIDPIAVDGHINGFDESADFPNPERVAQARATYIADTSRTNISPIKAAIA